MAAAVALGGPIGAALSGFLDKLGEANPALFEMLGDAFSDLAAVVGQVLVPVVKVVMPLIRLWGDFIASILPSQEQMNELAKAFAPALEAMREVMEVLAPIIQDVLVGALKILVKVISVVANAIKWFYESLLRLVGVDLNNRKPLKSSVGAAGRGASFVGIEQLGKNMMQSAFGGPVPLQEIADNTGRTADAAEKMASNSGDGTREGRNLAMQGFTLGGASAAASNY